jgi:hypothetical protein
MKVTSACVRHRTLPVDLQSLLVVIKGYINRFEGYDHEAVAVPRRADSSYFLLRERVIAFVVGFHECCCCFHT